MTQYTQHPLSAAFPALSDAEYQVLKDSIADLGVQNAITIFEGQVLDGWNRYRAATELDMECPARELDSWIDPRAFVLAQNKARRHITVAQMALATTAVYEWQPVGANQHRGSALSAEFQAGSALSAEAPKTSRELAEIAGVGVRSIEQARMVETQAAPEVKEAVKAGDMGLAKASAIAKLPLEQQAKAIHKPMREIAPAAAQPPASDAHGTALDMADGRGIDPAPAQRPKRAAPSTVPAVADDAGQAQQAQVLALQEEVSALREQLQEAQADNASIAQILDANDQLTMAMEEAKRERDLARGLQSRINSLMTQVADLKRQVAHWKKKAGG